MASRSGTKGPAAHQATNFDAEDDDMEGGLCGKVSQDATDDDDGFACDSWLHIQLLTTIAARQATSHFLVLLRWAV